MRVAAFDLSLTQTGWATWDGDVRRCGTIRPKDVAMARLDRVRREVLTIADGAELVVIEGYSYGSGNQAHQLGELGGVVRLSLWATRQTRLYRPPFVEVPPAVLKKYATGRGNAGKEEMLVAAVRRLGYEGSNNNEADALWLLSAGLDAYRASWAKLPEAQVEALAKLDWPPLGGCRWVRAA